MARSARALQRPQGRHGLGWRPGAGQWRGLVGRAAAIPTETKQRLIHNLRCAPRGLREALAEACGLAAGTPLEAVAAAVPALGWRAEQLAAQLVSGDLTRFIGPGKLLPTEWVLASKAQMQAQLRTSLSAYIQELLDIVQVSSTFNELTVPVQQWHSNWADGMIHDRHALELWGRPEVLLSGLAAWSGLGVGFSMLDGAVSPALAMRACQELEALAERGALTDFSMSTCNPGSRHLWLRFEDGADTPPALLELSRSLAGLPAALTSAAERVVARAPGALDTVPRLRLFSAAMAARYGPGSYYVPHLDMYSGGTHGLMNSRLLTIICYLNPNWQPGHGGELRVFAGRDKLAPDHERARLPELLSIRADHSESTTSTTHIADRFVDVEPLLGRVVMFRSRDVWHGIQELFSDRWALTLWLLADTT